MSYTVTGIIGKKTLSVTYGPEGLTGDAFAVRQVQERARELEGKLVGPVSGPYTRRDHLSDPLSALFVMRDVFEDITDASGDVPCAPDVPEGAVA